MEPLNPTLREGTLAIKRFLSTSDPSRISPNGLIRPPQLRAGEGDMPGALHHLRLPTGYNDAGLRNRFWPGDANDECEMLACNDIG